MSIFRTLNLQLQITFHRSKLKINWHSWPHTGEKICPYYISDPKIKKGKIIIIDICNITESSESSLGKNEKKLFYWQYIFVSNGNPPHAYELGGLDFKLILILINLNQIFIDQDLFISSLVLMPWCSNFWRWLDMLSRDGSYTFIS